MNSKFNKIICIFLILFWILLFSSLIIFTNTPNFLNWKTGSMITLILSINIFLCVRLYQYHIKTDEITKKNYLFQSLMESINSAQEFVIFDSNDQTIFSSNPSQYPNKNEFIRKITSKFTGDQDTGHFIHLIEKSEKGTCLLKGGGNGFNLKTKKVVAYVNPLESYLIITLTTVTSYFEKHNELQKQCSMLEEFIDNAPFGVFYLNSSNHLVGLNATLSNWINQTKNRVLGSPISDFIDVSNNKIKSIVNVLPHKLKSFKAILLPPSSTEKRLQAYILCQLDNNLLSSVDSKYDEILPQAFLDSPIPAVIITEDGKINSHNKAFLSIIGKTAHSLHPSMYFFELIEESKKEEVIKKLDLALQSKDHNLPFDVYFKNIVTHPSAYVRRIMPVDETNGNSNKLLVIQFIDTSEQKRLEQQFIQSQKMQAVGQLAGGIAHDFNNLLTAMIGFCDLLLQRYMPNDPSYMDVIQIKQNANRAANLVRQLLAFSRQQNLQPKVISITDTLAELSALLRRLIGARIELTMNHGRDIWPVLVDVSQLEQVIINLVVNARDSMENNLSGSLIIQTSNYTNTIPTQLGHDTMPIGDYVLISVIDTGHGIENDIIERIFEPFFSTKEIGAGTGLGLSTVFGIVKQTDGFINVDSTVGKGTKFHIYLPKHAGTEQTYNITTETTTVDLTGSETILLVEDEDAVRLFSARALRDKGYNVLEAENGNAALRLIEAGEKFDLLVTDVVMPHMDGPTLCQKIREAYPERIIKTIFISGYTEDTFRKNLGHNACIHFLQKPFTLKDLAQKVKEVLKEDDTHST